MKTKHLVIVGMAPQKESAEENGLTVTSLQTATAAIGAIPKLKSPDLFIMAMLFPFRNR